MRSVIMRVLLTIASAVLLLAIGTMTTSCSAMMEEIVDDIFVDYPYIEEPLDDVWQRSASFRYQPEEGDYWKSPLEFERDGIGDCEDFCAWMIYHLGSDARIVQCMREHDVSPHAIVEYRGQYIEPQTYGKTYAADQITISGSMSYDAVMKLSTAMRTK